MSIIILHNNGPSLIGICAWINAGQMSKTT